VDFIESLLGFAPDNGDGSLEAMIIGAVVIVVALFVFRRRIFGGLARKPNPR
jgi:hypothetical protein